MSETNENTGAVSSYHNERFKRRSRYTLVFILLAAAWLLRKKRFSPLLTTGIMLMAGGAAGNMADRFFTGFVPDMVEPLFVSFAVFNLADAALTVGCALVIGCLLFGRPEEKPREPEEKPREPEEIGNDGKKD